MANGDIAATKIGWTPVLPTDDFRLGYDRINQLADFLANLVTAVVGVPVASSGITLANVQCRKVNKRVLFSFQASGTMAQNTSLLTLPAGFMPAVPQEFAAGVHSSGAEGTGLVKVAANGVVSVGQQTVASINNLVATIQFDVP